MGKVIDLLLGVTADVIPAGYKTKVATVVSILAGLVMFALRVADVEIAGIDPATFSGKTIAAAILGGLAAYGIGDKIDRQGQ